MRRARSAAYPLGGVEPLGSAAVNNARNYVKGKLTECKKYKEELADSSAAPPSFCFRNPG